MQHQSPGTGSSRFPMSSGGKSDIHVLNFSGRSNLQVRCEEPLKPQTQPSVLSFGRLSESSGKLLRTATSQP